MIFIRRSLILILAVVFLILGINFVRSRQTTGIVKAFGPLLVTFPSEPMFDASNFYPGRLITNSFTVENTDDKTRQIVIKATDTVKSASLPLSNAINIIISNNGKILYGAGSSSGKKNLSAFYKESEVKLTSLKKGEKADYDISLQMDSSSGDEFQGQSVVFDILVGIDTFGFTRIPTIVPIPTFRPIPTIAIHIFPTVKPPVFNIRTR